MKRLIDADAVKLNFHRQGWNDSIDAIIENEPTVDAVEVVRCKDCKYRLETDEGEYNPEDIVCSYWSSDGLQAMDYCSYGERKEDNEQ